MTNSNNNALFTSPAVIARTKAFIASVNADANATDEERDMAQRAEASLAAHGLQEVTSRTIAANHNRLGDNRHDGPRMARS